MKWTSHEMTHSFRRKATQASSRVDTVLILTQAPRNLIGYRYVKDGPWQIIKDAKETGYNDQVVAFVQREKAWTHIY